jgi:copper resistance protein B
MAGIAVASPAMAQHSGHTMPGMTMPMPAQKPAPKKAPAKKPAPAKPPAKPVEAPQPDAHAGHQAPEGTGHEGHEGVAEPANPHADHATEPPVAAPEAGPPPAEALQGPRDAADTIWGEGAMQSSRAFLLTREHGRMSTAKLLIDQLEARVQGGPDAYFLNAEGWYGGDIDKLWLKTEIEGDFGHSLEAAEFQALWSHAIGPWWNLQTGVRIDAEPDTRGRLVVGVQGLAPYWIEVDAAAFLSDKGDFTARIEAEHDMRMTQRLILQPRAELNFALQDIPHERVGSGLSSVEAGLRLRYQLVPNFAPYLGINYERALGDSARLRRLDGDDAGGLQFVVGIRTWF